MLCNCKHLGNCPFRCDPARMTYPDGSPAFRAIGEGEPNDQRPGDALFKDAAQTRHVRAIDPARVESYARAKAGKKCRAESLVWAKAHPIPPVETS